MNNYKEFWIYEPIEGKRNMFIIAKQISDNFGCYYPPPVGSAWLRKNPVRVIEKSAYDELKNRILELEKLIAIYSTRKEIINEN